MNWVKKTTTFIAIVVIGGVCIQQISNADIGFNIGGDRDDNSGIGFHVGTNAYQMGRDDEANNRPQHEWARPWKQRQYDRGRDDMRAEMGGSSKKGTRRGKERTSRREQRRLEREERERTER